MPPTVIPDSLTAETPDALARLASWYAQAEAQLTDLLVQATLDGVNADQAYQTLLAIHEQMSWLLENAHLWDRENLAQSYVAGVEHAGQVLAAQGARVAEFPMGIATDALQALAVSATQERAAMLRDVLRESDDYLRSVATGKLAEGLALGDGAEDVGRALREALIDGVRTGEAQSAIADGIMQASGVVYSDGSVHSLHEYGMMAARTGMANAQREGTGHRFAQNGVHVVEIPDNGTLCFLCAPTEGKCFALDAEGEAMGYPPISAWYQTGAGHPNCKHVGFIPVLYPDKDEDRAPEASTLSATRSELYQQFAEDHPDYLKASRQGFSSIGEFEVAKAKHPNTPIEDLRGSRYRLPGINDRRKAAIVNMLNEPGLTYSRAMSRQTALLRSSQNA